MDISKMLDQTPHENLMDAIDENARIRLDIIDYQMRIGQLERQQERDKQHVAAALDVLKKHRSRPAMVNYALSLLAAVAEGK